MSLSRVRLEVDLRALEHNFTEIRRRVQPCRCGAVLKADAYGTGVLRAAEAVRKAGAVRIFTADVDEAIEVSAAGLPVQLLGTLFKEEAEESVARGFIVPLTSFESARMVSQAACGQNRTAVCQIKVDSGMGRFGMMTEEALEESRKIFALPGLKITGLYSHLSSADTPGNTFTQKQIARFCALFNALKNAGFSFEDVHISASNGIGFYSEALAEPFTFARAGVIMYGSERRHKEAVPQLKRVISLKSRLAAVRRMPAGSFIGYGHTYQAAAQVLVGTVPAGYEDGIPLALSNRGEVLIRGVRCPIVGRVCMDCFTVLLDGVPEARPGEEVICLGSDGKNEITPGDWAALKGTHVHDIMCSFGRRVERRYL